MQLPMFFRKTRHEPPRSPRGRYTPGEYVGRAVFRPKRTHDLRDDLRQAVGKVVDLVFVGVAGHEEKWAGQNVYMERGPKALLRGAWVADEDVVFIEAASGESQKQPLPGLLVMIVDDSRDTRDLYKLILTTAGYETIEAVDGAAAVSMAAANAPDAVVLDLNLPRMNGFDVIKKLRGEPETRHTPILAVTAHGEEAAERARQSGANGYCLKPALPEDLLNALLSVLPAAIETAQFGR